MTYLLPPSKKSQVRHKDGNKLNNHFENLEWVEFSEVNFLKIKKLAAAKFRSVRCITTGETFCSVSEAARQKGLFESSIVMVCKGKMKQTGGLAWEYYNKLQIEE